MTGEPLALYVHWPYCRSRCPYCDFNAHVPRGAVDAGRWRRAYAAEIRRARALTGPRALGSVFLGGGTPSLMEPDTVAGVLAAAAAAWPPAPDLEVTLEANPNSAEAARFRDFRGAGVNRVSVGVQSLDDRALRFLGRGHSAAEARRAVEAAAAVFPRFSFDLIYARPGQARAAWRSELADALALAGGHLSCYQLTVEEGTPFHAMRADGRLELPGPEEALALFRDADEILAGRGLLRYEVSNHALPGEEARHNLAYWRGRDYVGVGPGAHGRLARDGRVLALRQARDPAAWLGAVEARGSGAEEEAPLAPAEAAREMVLMGLRLAEGLDGEALARRTGVAFEDAVRADALARAEREGLCERAAGRLRATAEGLPVLDALVRELAR